MPPKRKVPARRASGKRVRIGDASVIASSPISPSGRKLRQASIGVDYSLTRHRLQRDPVKKLAKGVQDAQDPTPKRRGRPPVPAVAAAKADSPAVAHKSGRGRPKRVAVEATPQEAPSKSPKRKREVDDEPVADPPKKRGRPAKVKSPETTTAVTRQKPSTEKAQKENGKSKAKNVTKKAAPKAVAAATSIAKRGRPPGAKNVKPPTVLTKASKAKAPKKGPKAKSTQLREETEDELAEGLTQSADQGAAEFQYWLMKAEPDRRIEKGVDVAYPIDKLAAATEPEPWDGVRNAVARNHMRAMRKGDLAFFYHSNCAVPGIVGVMRIAEEHSIDESAFDPTHPYYDEKSKREKPKWDCVKVEFVKKFQDIISLKELKSTPELANMQIAQKAYGRLSVQSVTSDQWQFVLKMANEPEDLGVTTTVSGYEADTNGETDGEAVEESVGIDDVNDDKIAAYGNSGRNVDETINGHMGPTVNKEVQAEKDRIEAIDTFAKEIASGEA